MRQFTSDSIYNGKKNLFFDAVKDGDNLTHVFCVIDKALNILFENDLLDCIDLTELGITCPDKDASKICIIMDWLVRNVKANTTSIGTLTTVLQTIQTNIGQLNDEKVKVRAAGVTNYLENIIEAPNSSIIFTDNKISFTGFVPIGTRMTVNANRIGDFDVTGKGKVATDLWGWALRNGNNGLDNAMGKFLQYTENLLNADLPGGKKEFSIVKANISSFALPVTGIITDALEDNVKFKFTGTNNKNGGPRENGFASNHSGGESEYETQPRNFKHSHGFNLAASHNNPNPEPIPLIPEHIKEIPIERIIP